MGSFYTFMATALYLFLKRFYLHEIISCVVGVQSSIVQWTLLPTVLLVQRIMEIDFMNYYETSLCELLSYP